MVPVFDFDIGNVNISVNDPSSTQGPGSSKCDNLSAFAWHYDSFSFVCVTMLSDCTGMIGGETMIKTETGENMKLRDQQWYASSYISYRKLHVLLRLYRAQRR